MIRDCPWCKYNGAMGPQCYGQAENKDCPNFVPSVDVSQAFKNLDDAQSWIKYHYTELEVKLVELRTKLEQLNKDLAERQNKIIESNEKITKLRSKLRQQKRGYKKTRVIPSLDPELQPRRPLWWGR